MDPVYKMGEVSWREASPDKKASRVLETFNQSIRPSIHACPSSGDALWVAGVQVKSICTYFYL